MALLYRATDLVPRSRLAALIEGYLSPEDLRSDSTIPLSLFDAIRKFEMESSEGSTMKTSRQIPRISGRSHRVRQSGSPSVTGTSRNAWRSPRELRTWSVAARSRSSSASCATSTSASATSSSSQMAALLPWGPETHQNGMSSSQHDSCSGCGLQGGKASWVHCKPQVRRASSSFFLDVLLSAARCKLAASVGWA